jgi:hypothetical protein
VLSEFASGDEGECECEYECEPRVRVPEPVVRRACPSRLKKEAPHRTASTYVLRYSGYGTDENAIHYGRRTPST